MKLCEALGRPELGTDPRFSTNPHRIRNLEPLLTLLRTEIARRPAAELAAALDQAGVPCGAINSIPEAPALAQVRQREMVRAIRHPQGGTVPQIVSPVRFQNAPLTFDRPPPLLGQHTQEVLAEFGLHEATAHPAGEP